MYRLKKGVAGGGSAAVIVIPVRLDARPPIPVPLNRQDFLSWEFPILSVIKSLFFAQTVRAP